MEIIKSAESKNSVDLAAYNLHAFLRTKAPVARDLAREKPIRWPLEDFLKIGLRVRSQKAGENILGIVETVFIAGDADADLIEKIVGSYSGLMTGPPYQIPAHALPLYLNCVQGNIELVTDEAHAGLFMAVARRPGCYERDVLPLALRRDPSRATIDIFNNAVLDANDRHEFSEGAYEMRSMMDSLVRQRPDFAEQLKEQNIPCVGWPATPPLEHPAHEKM